MNVIKKLKGDTSVSITGAVSVLLLAGFLEWED
jgi:hypothetical protein